MKSGSNIRLTDIGNAVTIRKIVLKNLLLTYGVSETGSWGYLGLNHFQWGGRLGAAELNAARDKG